MSKKQSDWTRRQTLKTAGAAVGGSLVGITGFPALTRSAQQKRFLKPIVAGLNAPAGDPSYISISEIPRILREKYDVQLEIQAHPSSTLGSDVSHLEAVQNGFIDITSHGQSQWGTLTDAWLFTDLPYVFTDWDMAARFVKSDLHWQQAKRMEEQLPIKVLPPTAASGFRMLSNSTKQLRVPTDNTGLKYRTTGSPIEIELIKAWKGNPTPMAWTETYTALQTGVVNGIHVQPLWTFKFRMHEVLKHATEVKAGFSIQVQVMNRHTFNAMPESIQKPFMMAAQEAATLGWELDRSLEEKSKTDLKAEGMEIYTPTRREAAMWREEGESVWSKFDIDQSLLNAMRDLRTA